MRDVELVAHDLAADETRAEIERRWGKRAVISVAFALSASRFFPTLKYALGHGKACTRIVVGDAIITPHAASAA